MTPNQQKTKGSSGLFVQLAIILLGIVGGYIYYSQVVAPYKEDIQLPDIPVKDSLTKFKDVKSFNFEVLNDPNFKALTILGDIPVKYESTGRTDLFAPFVK